MTRIAILIAACVALGACNSAGRVGSAEATLRQAKADCDAQGFKTRTAYAKCANAAEEAFLVPAFPYPDLVRLKMATRMSIAERADAGTISPAQADLEMAKSTADLTAEIERRRNAAGLVRAQRDLANAAMHQTAPTTCVGGPAIATCF